MQSLWTNVFYKPLYNTLVFLTAVIPGGDLGFSVIVLTILVKIALFPITQKSIKSQVKLKNLEPEIQKIKEQYPNKEEQAKKTMDLYRQNKVNPFLGCILILIQLPIIFALYFVFLKVFGSQSDLLYSFIKVPAHVNTNFLGLIDLQGKSLFLAILAAVSQHVLARITTPKSKPNGDNKTFQSQLAQSMGTQMKYVLPIFIGFIAYKISAAVALYWVVSNLFTIGQELYVRRRAATQ